MSDLPRSGALVSLDPSRPSRYPRRKGIDVSLATRIQTHLQESGVVYESLRHAHSETSQETAESSHVPGDQLAKGVLLEKQDGTHILAVLPATHVVHYSDIEARCGSSVRPASKASLGEVFDDCEVGAVPPFGMLYGLPTLVEETLFGQDPVYFEAGDHESVVRVSANDFRSLLAGADFLSFSARPRRGDT